MFEEAITLWGERTVAMKLHQTRENRKQGGLFQSHNLRGQQSNSQERNEPWSLHCAS